MDKIVDQFLSFDDITRGFSVESGRDPLFLLNTLNIRALRRLDTIQADLLTRVLDREFLAGEEVQILRSDILYAEEFARVTYRYNLGQAYLGRVVRNPVAERYVFSGFPKGLTGSLKEVFDPSNSIVTHIDVYARLAI